MTEAKERKQRKKKNLRVATGRLNESITRLDAARSLSLFNHAQGNAILDTATGIEVLQFGVDGSIDSQGAGQTVQSNKGGVAYLLGDCIQSDRRDAGGSGRSHDVRECTECTTVRCGEEGRFRLLRPAR